MASSLVGRKLGTYKITDMLGQGGMATVYKGYREDIDRYVAIKVLPPHPGLDQQFIERFRLEARTIAKLQHPHILPLYDYGVEDDILYLVMAYIEGGSLSNRIDRGQLNVKEVDTLLRQIAPALDYAHRQGVIHRDIKPDNILLDKEGHPLLADFGIAKMSTGGSKLTVTGGLVGTPAYMAPEQASGETDISASADIYSLGIVVYEMLTGKQPFTAETPMQVVLKHMTEPIPSIVNQVEGLPATLELVMQRVLSKSPQNRYKTAAEFAEDFNRAIQGVSLDADSTAILDFNARPSPDPTILAPAATPTLTDQPATPTQTIIMQQGFSPLVVLGGFAIIAVLIVVVLALVLNRPPETTVDSPTAETLIATATTAQVVVATVTEGPSFGRLSFSTTNKTGDTVTLQVENLTPPGADEVYAAWLMNTSTDGTIKLGDLTLDPLGNGVLPPYVDKDGRVLPADFNAITVTRETGEVEAPTGEILYSASVPIEVAEVMQIMYVTSGDGIPFASLNSTEYSPAVLASGPTAGLLDSIIAEGIKARDHAGLAQRAGTVGGMHLHNEHTINITQGALNDLNGDGRGENPGFQKGIYFYIDLINQQLTTAANATGSTLRLQSDLELIRICLDNTRIRADQLVVFEQDSLASPDVESVAQQAIEATKTAAAILNGVDANGNGQVEAFEGECGLMQIRAYGLVAASMSLLQGGLPE